MQITSWSLSTWTVGALVFAAPLAAQKINPTNQINWPLSTGTTAPSAACTAVNYGQPYTDTTHNIPYVCSGSGWISGGSGGGGVTSINGTSGAYTFAGSGVLCVSTTCTFTGGSSGGVGPGVVNNIARYNTTSQVLGDGALSDGSPTAPLTYNGPLGASFNASGGGSYSFLTNNSGATPPFAASQITLATTLGRLSTPQANAGNISLTATDSIGNAGGSNINLSASTPLGPGVSNSGNVNITASGYFPNNSGFVNILGSGVSIQDNGAGVAISSNGGQPAAISLVNNTPAGNIQLNANSGAGGITISSNTIAVDNSGDTVIYGTFTAPNLLAASGTGCIYTDAAGLFHTTNSACGGSGGSIGGSGTVGTIPIFVTNTTTLGNSPLSVSAGILTTTDPLAVNDGSGTGLALIGVQGTAPSPATGSDTFWADSTANRWKMNNNNTGNQYVPGIATAGTSGDCVKLAANGIDLVDNGTTCGSSSPGIPTHVADSGAGTGGSLAFSFVSGYNDNNGSFNLTTGGSPAANSGLITIIYGGTYANPRKCIVAAGSALSAGQMSNVFIPPSTSTTTQFVITVAGTAFPANTTGYVFTWRCGD